VFSPSSGRYGRILNYANFASVATFPEREETGQAGPQRADPRNDLDRAAPRCCSLASQPDFFMGFRSVQ
jgi:hypothetical protein